MAVELQPPPPRYSLVIVSKFVASPLSLLSGDSEEASELRAAAQDLETQIEEQKLKIQNTPKILRVSYIVSILTLPTVLN